MNRRSWVRVPALVALACAGAALAQRPETRSEVELPLSVYDQLRAAAREKKGLTPEAAADTPSFAACRVLRASVAVDLDARRASWDVLFEATSRGPESPEVPLFTGPASIGRSSVEPASGARLDSSASGTKLVAEDAGAWRVALSGEIGGGGVSEADGISFALPQLACRPSVFDLSLPERSTAVFAGRAVAGRLALGPEDGTAPLIVRRSGRRDAAPATVAASLSSIHRLSGDSVRTEVRLILRVRKGTLDARSLLFPGASLVLVNGPALVTGPDEKGVLGLRFEPAVPAGRDVALSLSFLSKRDEKADVFTPVVPRFPAAPDEPVEKAVTVVSEAGLLLESAEEGDWTAARTPDAAAFGADDVALTWKSGADDPRPLRLKVQRLQGLSVASALARLALSAYVGETGDVRILMTANVRTRSRSSLAFRVPKDAVLLAAQVDGATAFVSRSAPDRLEVPIAADSGGTRITLLVSVHVTPPRDGEKLELVGPAPEEPIERATWTVVLPIGLSVKEPGRRLPSPGPEPATGNTSSSTALAESERAAAAFAATLATTDRLATPEAGWSAEPALPSAPAAYVGDFSDLGNGLPPLQLTIEKRKQKEEWF